MWTINPCDEEEDPNWGVGWGHNGSEVKESPNDRYWREMEERKKQRRDWEDRGEPIGF